MGSQVENGPLIWSQISSNQHYFDHSFREKPNRECPEFPRDISKDSGFEDEDYFYLDDDYLLLPNAVTLLENKSDERYILLTNPVYYLTHHTC